MKRIASAALLLLLLGLTGCASSPLMKQTYEDQLLSDPYESINRKTYAFNEMVDKVALRPLAKGYSTLAPLPLRIGLKNAFTNATEPLNIVNNLLQFKVGDSLNSLTRFAFNSTLGLGGLIDITGDMGIPYKEEDFGQTLAYWGVKPGPYIMVPFTGRSNLRDSIGDIPDSLFGLTSITDSTAEKLAISSLDTIVKRTGFLGVDKVLSKQVDPYIFLRSSYEQSRLDLVHDGEPPEFEEDF